MRVAPARWEYPTPGATVSGVVTIRCSLAVDTPRECVSQMGYGYDLGGGTASIGATLADDVDLSIPWDTTGHPDGPVTLRCAPMDRFGLGYADHAELVVTVDN